MIKKVFSGLACALIAFLAVTGCSMDPAADAGGNEAAAVDRAAQTTSSGVKIIKNTIYVNSSTSTGTDDPKGAFSTGSIKLSDFDMPDLIWPDYDEQYLKMAYIEVAAYGYEYGGDGIISYNDHGTLSFTADQYNIPPSQVDLRNNVQALKVSTPSASPVYPYAMELPGMGGASPRYRLGHCLLSSNDATGHAEIQLSGNYDNINPGDTFDFEIRIYATYVNTTPDNAAYSSPVLKAVYHYTLCFVGETKMAIAPITQPNSAFYSNYLGGYSDEVFYPLARFPKEKALIRNISGENCWLYVFEKGNATALTIQEIKQGVTHIPLSSLACYPQLKTGTTYYFIFRKDGYNSSSQRIDLVEGGMIFIPC